MSFSIEETSRKFKAKLRFDNKEIEEREDIKYYPSNFRRSSVEVIRKIFRIGLDNYESTKTSTVTVINKI